MEEFSKHNLKFLVHTMNKEKVFIFLTSRSGSNITKVEQKSNWITDNLSI